MQNAIVRTGCCNRNIHDRHPQHFIIQKEIRVICVCFVFIAFQTEVTKGILITIMIYTRVEATTSSKHTFLAITPQRLEEVTGLTVEHSEHRTSVANMFTFCCVLHPKHLTDTNPQGRLLLEDPRMDDPSTRSGVSGGFCSRYLRFGLGGGRGGSSARIMPLPPPPDMFLASGSICLGFRLLSK